MVIKQSRFTQRRQDGRKARKEFLLCAFASVFAPLRETYWLEKLEADGGGDLFDFAGCS
jgi:hypothetical protein